MAETKLTTLLLAALLAALPAAPHAFCQESGGDRGLCYEWKRVPMDGHRTSGGVELSPSARKEKQLLQSCEPALAPLKQVVAYSNEEMKVYRPQSPLGNLISDILFIQTQKAAGVKCDLVLTNVGGIRQDMPKGKVIMDDIAGMFPFKNNMIIADIRGDRLLELFNHMASHNWEIFSGAKVVADSSSVVSMIVGGRPLEKNKVYKLAVNSFLFKGGDGICVKTLSEGSVDTGIKISDMVLSYLNEFTPSGGKLHAELDDRLVFADGIKKTVGAHEADPWTASKFQAKPASAPQRDGNSRKKLTILHTNDTHSAMEPLRFGEYVGMAGVEERAAFIDSVRTADGKSNVLLLDAGDYSQGTTYFSTFGGRVEVEAMNIMRYDVATLGNHEWDNGADALADRLKKSKWSTVLCNYGIENESVQKAVKPYVIVRRGGLKIGIIGALANITEVTDKSLVNGLAYKSPIGPLNSCAELLKKKKGCDMVIVLSHCGMESRYVNDMGDMNFVSQLSNVDIIIGGHTHTDLLAPIYVEGADGKPVMIVTDYCNGIYVGQITCYR